MGRKIPLIGIKILPYGIFSPTLRNLPQLPCAASKAKGCLHFLTFGARDAQKKARLQRGSRTLYKVWAILLSLQTDRVIDLLHRHQFAERLRRAVVSGRNDAGSCLNRLGQTTGLAGRRKLLAGQRTPFVFRILRN